MSPWDGGPSVTWSRMPTLQELTFHFGTEAAKRPEWQKQQIAHQEAESSQKKESAGMEGSDCGDNQGGAYDKKDGLTSRGIPLMVATVTTVLTMGASAMVVAGSTGVASTTLVTASLNGTISASGNAIGQAVSGSDFDYADVGISFGAGMLPNPWASTIIGSFLSASVDVTAQKGLQTPFQTISGKNTKSWGTTASDVGFGMAGGMAGMRLDKKNASLLIKISTEAATETINNVVNDKIDQQQK